MKRSLLLTAKYSFVLGPIVLGLVLLGGCNKKEVKAPTPASNTRGGPVVSAEPPRPPLTDISMKAQGERIPVIMYHDVIPERDRSAQWFDISRDEFIAQLDKIQELGMTPISLDQLYGHLTAGAPVPPNAIVLTFDDNYQGFYDIAYPLLKERGYPAAMFVHTGFVGNLTQGRPKMTWDTLKELVKDPLITIGNHTITHPEDITQIDRSEQEREIIDAKRELETQLGKTMDYFAYPNGKNDEVTQLIARAAGHKMSFSIHNGLAEESPNIESIDRYIHTRFETALEDKERALRGGALGLTKVPLQTSAPVHYEEKEYAGVRLGLVTGGAPASVMSESREGVRDFVRRTQAVAGVNGGFFAMAAVASTDNRMVGPWKTPEQPEAIPDLEKFRWEKLVDRPLVLWGPKEFGIVPYQPESMMNPEVFRDFMPDYTDTFLSGVWLVHAGAAREREDMNEFSSKDIQDSRKRAFLGVKADGTFVVGASLESVSSYKLSPALVEAGLQEAVLLDSGFSTSLVYGESIKAWGHSSATNPSRPVPHAVVIRGTMDPTTASLGADTGPPPVEPSTTRKRKRRRRRKASSTSSTSSSPVTASPDPASPTP